MRRPLMLPSLVLALSLPSAGPWSLLSAAEPEAAGPAPAKPTAATAKGAPKLDAEVTALLRRTALALENRAIEPDEQAGFRALITAGDLLREDKTLAPSERERLRALCRVRLAQAEEVLKRQTAKERGAKEAAERKAADDGKRKIVARNAVLKRPATVAGSPSGSGPANPTLAQQFPGGGFGGQNAGGQANPNSTRASAEALMEIITSSIKPESWEENGGSGVIRYFQLGHGLVIRATADVHGDLGDLVGQLRK